MVIKSSRRCTSGGLSTRRIEAFSDGVFAIVITLLILDIKVPDKIPEAMVATQLLQKLFELWPKFLSYVISFWVIGVLWVTHHNAFHYIKRSDQVLLWLNILFLMCVAFIPFPTALIGQYGQQQIAVAMYGANLLVTRLVFQLLWWYATSGHRLVDSNLDPRFVSKVTRRILTPALVDLLAIGISFFSIPISILLYILILVLYSLPSAIDRHLMNPQGREPESG